MKRIAFAAVLGLCFGVLIRDIAQERKNVEFMLLVERASKACEQYGQVLAIEGTTPVCVRRIR